MFCFNRNWRYSYENDAGVVPCQGKRIFLCFVVNVAKSNQLTYWHFEGNLKSSFYSHVGQWIEYNMCNIH